MGVLYKETKYDVVNDEESLTEQEHRDDCDINLMIKNLDRGNQVRGGGSTQYGYDDTTMDGVQLRIQKANLEEALLNGEKEFTQQELDLFPKDIQQKFGYKLKKQAAQPKATNNELNDEQPQELPKKQAKPKKPTTEPKDSEHNGD